MHELDSVIVTKILWPTIYDVSNGNLISPKASILDTCELVLQQIEVFPWNLGFSLTLKLIKN